MEKSDFTTDVFGSKEMLQPSPADRIPQHGTRPDIAYQMVKDERAYRQTVKCAFLNRRKTLENNLVNFFGFSREQAKGILAEAGIDEKARGETLSPERFALLADALLDEGIIKA